MMDQAEIHRLLLSEYEKSGINTGDIVLIHSSLKRLLKKIKSENKIEIKPEIILKSILDRLGERGTLILPLFNFDFPKTKFFDLRTTPSQMGALTELGRMHPDAVRTGHPIYSFAVIGKNSNDFKNVCNYSGYGSDSPFSILQRLGGKIAIIGLDDQNSMTSYHYVEEMHEVDYRYHKKFFGNYVDIDGVTTEREFGLFVRDIERGVQTDVNRMGDLLWQKSLYQGEAYDQGFGIRSIKFSEFYNCVSDVIKSGKAIDYLYSIKKD